MVVRVSYQHSEEIGKWVSFRKSIKPLDARGTRIEVNDTLIYFIKGTRPNLEALRLNLGI